MLPCWRTIVPTRHGRKRLPGVTPGIERDNRPHAKSPGIAQTIRGRTTGVEPDAREKRSGGKGGKSLEA
jgi:hypothetical protein